MRKILLLILIPLSIAACGQKKNTTLTVVLYDNQHPDFKFTVDTLLQRKKISLINTPIDIFFSSENFHLPYYVPSVGMYKNAAKDKECDMKIYPGTVKCYEYDDKKRVIKMIVHGSGTENVFNYSYNNKDQILEVTGLATKYLLTYNADGTLSALREIKGNIEKKLVFIYN